MNTERPSIHIGVNTLFLIPGEVGGSETYLCQILDAICRRDNKAGFTLFTNSENHSFMRSSFGKYQHVKFSKLNFKASNRFARILREQFELPFKVKLAGVDVLWSPGYTAPAVVHCPQAVTIHDMQYKHHPEDFTQLAMFTTDFLIRMAGFRAQKFLTVSEFSKSEIIRYVNIPKKKICVTYLAADDFAKKNLTNDEAKKIVSKLIPNSDKYILTVANSYPHKNLHTLIDAFARIENRIPHRLVVVGKPRLGEGQLKESMSRISNPDRVIRIFGLPRKAHFALYRSADLFVFP
ncbi:MAG: glycosyltransferase family 4 protein, partial [Desulfobacterales bacterium]